MSTTPKTAESTVHRFRWRWVVVVVGLMLAIGFGVYQFSQPNTATLMRQAKREFIRGEHRQALETVERILIREPTRSDALVLAGDTAFEMEQYDQALDYYRRVPFGSSKEAIHARFRCGRIEMHHTGNSEKAEADFRAALDHDPENRNGLFQLASLLGIQARRTEAIPLILRLFRQGVFNADFLGLLESENGALFNLEELQRYQKANPDNANVLVGLAWHARNSKRLEEALDLLARAMKSNSELAEVRIAMARLLWDLDRFDELRLLLAAQESQSIDDSRIWLIRGRLAEHDNRKEAAARCYWESLRGNPTNRTSTYKLFQYFTDINDEKTAALLQSRMTKLLQLRATSNRVTSEPQTDAEPVWQLVDQLEQVGRIWEAWGWSVVARDLDSDANRAVARTESLHSILIDAPLTVVCRPLNPVYNLSHLPQPNWSSAIERAQASSTSTESAVTFRNDATTAGLEFQYFNSPNEAGQRMYEFNGGGCGVLDYDTDGWPDVHFTQGCHWDSRGDQSEFLDRLFRNSGSGTFTDVTDLAGLFENRFSTGIAVADFDNDGFADCYVANIGGNRLFHNNGDGTFLDVTEQADVSDPGWSTSCVMADLNGDSLPDIYSVNYLEGDSIFETVCQHQDGRPRMCMPFHFPAAQDQLYLNQGDGRFVNATQESGIQVPDGKGLGIVAADWAGNGRLSLFVANDTVPNFFFDNQKPEPDQAAVFVEQAMTSGIALNHAGRAEGCMGIAVGDADEDGNLDVFVTNFLRESNTLYRSLTGSTFADATREFGLVESSLPMLGFGTQFLDANLDGRLDLIVANGHIDDYRHYDRPYRMPPQFYYNSGDGRFSLQPGDQVGPYFSSKCLGRSLARWDWNRDGREDAVISNLDQPVALLTNTTEPHGRSLSIRLKGTGSSRDAIGAKVVLHLAERTVRRQLTAGDGYQASNERLLVFGLADSSVVKRMEIAWPSGVKNSWDDVDADSEYMIVEGADRLFRSERPKR